MGDQDFQSFIKGHSFIVDDRLDGFIASFTNDQFEFCFVLRIPDSFVG